MNLLTRFFISLSILLFMGYGHLSAHKVKNDNTTFPLKTSEQKILERDLRVLYSQVLTIEEAPSRSENLPEIEATTNENREEEEDESEDEEDELTDFKKHLNSDSYFA